ncbi:MAG: dethiobiotin synthase [Mucinivorans sp.]
MITFTPGRYFITGIDTDAGKSYATAYLARLIQSTGLSVITQKFVQTGCNPSEISEDILTHRRLQGIAPTDEDKDGTTCPEIFHFPCSPHLAATLDNRVIDLDKITNSTKILSHKYDVVLIEGAGGLLVPINGKQTTADYIKNQNLETIVVTSARLGSINHTLLTLEVCKNRGIEVKTMIFNHYPESDPTLTAGTIDYLQRYTDIPIIELPILSVPQ